MFRWLYLPIQIKERELDANLILALTAATRGWAVVIGSKDIVHLLDRMPKGVYLRKNIGPRSAHKVKRLIDLGHRVFALCEEGLVYRDAALYVKKKIDRDGFELLDGFFCWGEAQKSDLVQQGLDPKKMHIVGNPRFDLYRPEMKSFFNEAMQDLKKKLGNIILVNTRFSGVNGSRDPLEILEKQRSLGQITTEKEVQEAKDGLKFQKRLIGDFIKLVKDLEKYFPDHAILIRPHPAENPDFWKALAVKSKRIKIDTSENVAESILAADLIIHTNCTTAVEAFALGTPSIALRTVVDDRFDFKLPNALSTVECNNYKDVLELINSILENKYTFNNDREQRQKDLIAHYVASVSKSNACNNIIDVFDGMGIRPQSTHPDSINLNDGLLKTRLRSIKIFLGKAIGFRSKLPYNIKVERSEIVKINHVLSRVKRLKSTIPAFNDVKIITVGPGLICFYK